MIKAKNQTTKGLIFTKFSEKESDGPVIRERYHHSRHEYGPFLAGYTWGHTVYEWT